MHQASQMTASSGQQQLFRSAARSSRRASHQVCQETDQPKLCGPQLLARPTKYLEFGICWTLQLCLCVIFLAHPLLKFEITGLAAKTNMRFKKTDTSTQVLSTPQRHHVLMEVNRPGSLARCFQGEGYERFRSLPRPAQPARS